MNLLAKNLNALKNQELKEALSGVKNSHFKPIFGKDSLELNISNGGVLCIKVP